LEGRAGLSSQQNKAAIKAWETRRANAEKPKKKKATDEVTKRFSGLDL
jgi:hypothetical protein